MKIIIIINNEMIMNNWKNNVNEERRRWMKWNIEDENMKEAMIK